MKHQRLEDQIRECFGRVVYTHKTHEKMADLCSEKLQKLKTAQIWATALTSSGALGSATLDEKWLEILTAVLAVITLVLAAYLKNFDLGELAQKHRNAASKIWAVRESYLSLLTDFERLSEDEVVRRRDELQDVLAAIYLGAPQTNYAAYKKAQDGLKNNEELTFNAKEIDLFLPQSLRKASRNETPVSQSKSLKR